MNGIAKSRTVQCVALAVVAMSIVGCSKRAHFNVLRAAKVNVQAISGEGADATVSMGRWEGHRTASADIRQRIRERVVNAEGNIVQFAESGGVLSLNGLVSEYSFEDKVKSKKDKCTKRVKKKKVKYDCVKYTRQGKARIRVSMNVIDRNGLTVASESYTNELSPVERSVDEQPPEIDWHTIMEGLRDDAAESLAPLIVPYRVSVQKPWFSCGEASTLCDAGLVHLQQGAFTTAEDMFKQALVQLEADPEPDNEAKAAAWWGLTLAHEFSGDFAAARSSLKEAIALDPINATYLQEKSLISKEEQNSRALQKQGLETSDE